MQSSRLTCCILAIFLLCAGTCIALPATAAEGMVTIAYRGSGGSYIGDTIVFDGLNTAGNMTVIKVTGPDLPAEGVPLYDLSGTPGSGNTVKVDLRNQWVFPWDMSRINGSKLQTARYTFTAWDLEKSGITATTSLVLKRPEFYLMAKPTTGRIGDYIELEGMAEKGVSYIKLDITDTAGTVVHTFITPVSSLGFFQHGFRFDMQPGQYYVTGTNPSMKNNLGVVVTVSAPETTATATPLTVVTASAPVTSVETGTVASPVPTQAGNFSAALALSLICIGTAALCFRRG